MSADPIDSAYPTAPQSWNKFAYGLNNPLRFLDPTGLAVMVFDSQALELIKSTLPEELRKFVEVGSSGLIEADPINSVNSNNENFLALRELVNTTEMTLGVSTAKGFKDASGRSVEFEFESVESIKNRMTAMIGADEVDRIGEIIPTLFLGIFLPTSESLRGMPEVVVSDGTGRAATAPYVERSVTTAHEVFGHALLFFRGESFKHDKGKIDKVILGIETRTRRLYQ